MRLAVNLPEARPDGKVKKGHNKIPSPPSSSEHGQFADAAVALAAWCGAMFNATDEMTLDAASNTHCTGNRDDLTTQKQQPMIAWTSLTTQLSHVTSQGTSWNLRRQPTMASAATLHHTESTLVRLNGAGVHGEWRGLELDLFARMLVDRITSSFNQEKFGAAGRTFDPHIIQIAIEPSY